MVAEPPPDPARHAEDAGLRYVTDAEPGITRRRRGTGFSYHLPDGSRAPERERARIEALVIPPAWEDVWICADARGHLQATGRDARGRKQYRYHSEWQRVRSEAKFSRMVLFGEALPTLRSRVEADLRRRALDREKVLALVVSLLDRTLIRIGNAKYAEDNGSYGLTTLRDRHVAFEGGRARLTFVGKSGQEREAAVDDRRLARLVKACRDLPGYNLFQYRTARGKERVGSADVNAYLRETTGQPFSAKDFRTWGGTVLAAKAFRARGEAASEADAHIRAVCEEVAAALGNTVAVCRAYYIHPQVVEAYREGALLEALAWRNCGNTPAGLAPEEAAVITLLRERA